MVCEVSEGVSENSSLSSSEAVLRDREEKECSNGSSFSLHSPKSSGSAAPPKHMSGGMRSVKSAAENESNRSGSSEENKGTNLVSSMGS